MTRYAIILLAALGCAEKASVMGEGEAPAVSESMTGDEFHEGTDVDPDSPDEGSGLDDGSGPDDGFGSDEEICDGIDNDGDGEIDEGVTTTFYVDEDGDGWGGNPVEACEQVPGMATVDGDCDDEDAAVNPDAEEICDEIDNDCNDAIDEALSSTFFEDADGDGYGNPGVGLTACAMPDGYTDNALDCDDTASLVSPGAEEVCNGVDDNCDGRADEGVGTLLYPDSDADGFGNTSAGIISCWDLTDHVAVPGDCDDSNETINPDADEACDLIDNDCDGAIDEFAVTGLIEYWMDVDGDGHGAGVALTGCLVPDGFADSNDDCDDMDPLRAPSIIEVCNGYDDDCDEGIDEGVMSAYYIDADGDGWGTGEAFFACERAPGTATNNTDCDDTRAEAYPGGEEVCDGIDNDCNAIADDEPVDGDTFYADVDADGFGDPSVETVSCETPAGYVDNYTDCDPADDATYPGAPEVCDSRDNDCDGAVDDDPSDPPTWYADDDMDGFGTPDITMSDCEPDVGYVASSDDCDDEDPSINPDADEVCNDIDDDCDGVIDLDAVDGGVFFYDGDGDGYGSGEETFRCTSDDMWVDNSDDCNDDDASIYPFAYEECDGQDQDCNGLADDEADCPCEQMNWSGDSYLYCNSRKKWTQARDYCQDYGYNLISVNGYAEQAWIINIIRYDGRVANDSHWIGLNDRSWERGSSRSGWSWQSGDSYSWEAWSSMYSQPDDYGGEDCVEVNRWDWRAADDDWNDLDCNDRLRFICEAN